MRKTLLALCIGALAAFGALSSASAADPASYQYYTKAPRGTVFDWSGYYLKGDLGYVDGNVDLSAFGFGVATDPRGVTAGVGLGFDYQLSSGIVFGAVLDAAWLGAKDNGNIGPVPVQGEVDYLLSLRGNLGYSMGTWLPYATLGYSCGHVRSEIAIANLSADDFTCGLAYGAGLKMALTKNVALTGEWVRHDLGNGTLNFGPGSAAVETKIDRYAVGVQYRF
jgi:opacity protein-like surface antigen